MINSSEMVMKEPEHYSRLAPVQSNDKTETMTGHPTQHASVYFTPLHPNELVIRSDLD